MDTGPATELGSPAAASLGRSSAVASCLMLALQEQVGAEIGDREARRHGQRLLAALSGLQRALLSGGGPQALRELAVLAETEAHAADSGLSAIIGSIRMRAQIELAKAERSAISSG